MSPQSLPYRLGVGIVLLNTRGSIFVARRIDTRSEAWQMPQGGIDEGEDPRAAAFRELQEETGIPPKSVSLLAESEGWFDYDLPEELVGKIWGGKYRGQKQKWFALRFLGEESEINLETESPEFLEWRWAEPAEVPRLIVPFKRKLYEDVLKGFQHIIS